MNFMNINEQKPPLIFLPTPLDGHISIYLLSCRLAVNHLELKVEKIDPSNKINNREFDVGEMLKRNARSFICNSSRRHINLRLDSSCAPERLVSWPRHSLRWFTFSPK